MLSTEGWFWLWVLLTVLLGVVAWQKKRGPAQMVILSVLLTFAAVLLESWRFSLQQERERMEMGRVAAEGERTLQESVKDKKLTLQEANELREWERRERDAARTKYAAQPGPWPALVPGVSLLMLAAMPARKATAGAGQPGEAGG